ncbi:transposase [Phormidesmis priestleyi ANT.L61.2]
MVDLLRLAFRTVKARLSLTIEAIVVLLDHLHCVWMLPEGHADFSKRWRLIKSEFSRCCPDADKRQCSASRLSEGEQAIWQRWFWEHQIRDERDFARHVDYVHYNPVRHGLAMAPKDWVYSSFHRDVRKGDYSLDWGADGKIGCADGIGNE